MSAQAPVTPAKAPMLLLLAFDYPWRFQSYYASFAPLASLSAPKKLKPHDKPEARQSGD